MNLTEAPYFAILKARLDFLGRRQQLVAENIANASTPGYTPRDLDVASFEQSLARAAQSGGARRGGTASIAQPRVVTAPDGETTLDGNSVVLEDQTFKASEIRGSFELGLTLYQKGLAMMRMAARPPR